MTVGGASRAGASPARWREEHKLLIHAWHRAPELDITTADKLDHCDDSNYRVGRLLLSTIYFSDVGLVGDKASSPCSLAAEPLDLQVPQETASLMESMGLPSSFGDPAHRQGRKAGGAGKGKAFSQHQARQDVGGASGGRHARWEGGGGAAHPPLELRPSEWAGEEEEATVSGDWQKVFDSGSGYYYYYNYATDLSQWEEPADWLSALAVPASPGPPQGTPATQLTQAQTSNAPEAQMSNAPEAQMSNAPGAQMGNAPGAQMGNAPGAQMGNAPGAPGVQMSDAPEGGAGPSAVPFPASTPTLPPPPECSLHSYGISPPPPRFQHAPSRLRPPPPGLRPPPPMFQHAPSRLRPAPPRIPPAPLGLPPQLQREPPAPGQLQPPPPGLRPPPPRLQPALPCVLPHTNAAPGLRPAPPRLWDGVPCRRRLPRQ